MAQRDQTVAGQIWPHLVSDEAEPRGEQRRDRNPIAEAMYPNLVPKPKPQSSPERERLIQAFRETTAKIRGSEMKYQLPGHGWPIAVALIPDGTIIDSMRGP